MRGEIPMKGGLEGIGLDRHERKHIRLRPGIRHEAKRKFAKRARRVAKLATKGKAIVTE